MYLETPSAQVTVERFVARVLPAVSDEVGGLAKCLATHDAFVWLLT